MNQQSEALWYNFSLHFHKFLPNVQDLSKPHSYILLVPLYISQDRHEMCWNSFFKSSFFFSFFLSQQWQCRLVAAGFVIQPIWHLVYPERQTYSVSVSPVGWRLWLASDVLNYWSGWLLLILLSYYWFTASVLVGSVVSNVVLGIQFLLCSRELWVPWAE